MCVVSLCAWGEKPLTALEEARVALGAHERAGRIDKGKAGWRERLPRFPELSFASGGRYLWRLETSEGTLVAELDPDTAPEHVRNVIWLTEVGFYDGLVFHRIIPGFMAQGGCPRGRGDGNPGYQVSLEVKAGVRHDGAGVLSMARTPAPNSAGSQFFITFGATPQLDGKYSIFGRVMEGREVLGRLEAAGNPDPMSNGVPPRKEVRIVRATVEWVSPGEPERE